MKKYTTDLTDKDKSKYSSNKIQITSEIFLGTSKNSSYYYLILPKERNPHLTPSGKSSIKRVKVNTIFYNKKIFSHIFFIYLSIYQTYIVAIFFMQKSMMSFENFTKRSIFLADNKKR